VTGPHKFLELTLFVGGKECKLVFEGIQIPVSGTKLLSQVIIELDPVIDFLYCESIILAGNGSVLLKQ
jgi:hypothetical protein